MNADDPALEPDRYELREGPAYLFELGRRDFLKGLGGIVVVFAAASPAAGQESGGSGRRRPQPPTPELSAWLHVGDDGVVTVFTGKVEIGQDIRTSLAQLVAEELPVPLPAVRLVMADTDRTPFDSGTVGSRTTPQMGTQLRRAAAAARELLLRRAAERWSVEADTLRIEDGRVVHPDGRAPLAIGALAKDPPLTTTVDENVPLRAAEKWRVAGRDVPKVDGRDVVTGARQYTSDLTRPGLLVGKVLRPPSPDAKLQSLDARAAEAIAGVRVVRDGDFAGVTAASGPAAEDAVDALRAEWTEAAHPEGRRLYEILRRESGPPRPAHETGSIDEGLAAAAHRLEATYTIPYIAHVPLEPRAALAEWSEGKLTVWTGTQRPFGVRTELAKAFHLDEAAIRVVVPDTGSGYGGKHTGDAALEAARLAKGAGRPVKVVWTREEEFRWAYFRPAGVIDIRSGIRKDGTLTAWDFHNYNSGTAGIRTPYEVPHQRIVFHAATSPLRQGSYRALAATANNFARESHVDDMARAAQMNPLAFRQRNLKDSRLDAVLAAAADRFRWDEVRPSAERGFGLALGTEKGGYVATCVEIAIEPQTSRVRVVRIATAFECGAIVNPDHLRNQVEGAVLMGLGGALFEEIEFDRGKILNPHLSHYHVPRLRDVPVLETVLLDRKDLPSAGAGEAPIVGVAPALGNAIVSATGRRVRALPLTPRGVLRPPDPSPPPADSPPAP